VDHATLISLVAGGVLGDLDVDERRALDAHLPACDHCRALVRDLDDTLASLALAAVPRPAPERLGSEILRLIRTDRPAAASSLG
jgi:anti-sigma factor RsiW